MNTLTGFSRSTVSAAMPGTQRFRRRGREPGRPGPAGRRRSGAGRRSKGRLTVSRERARQLALSLPEAVEQDHHGRPSFRVAGRIFATQWDEHHMNVMLDEGGILTAAQSEPEICSEVWWGKRRAAVRVDLRRAEAELLTSLLTEAWETKAPKRLLRDPRAPGRYRSGP